MWETEALVQKLSEKDSVSAALDQIQKRMTAFYQDEQFFPRICPQYNLLEQIHANEYNRRSEDHHKMESAPSCSNVEKCMLLNCGKDKRPQRNENLQSQNYESLHIFTKSKIKAFADDINVLNSKCFQTNGLPQQTDSTKARRFYVNHCDGDKLRANTLRTRDACFPRQKSFRKELKPQLGTCDAEVKIRKPWYNCPQVSDTYNLSQNSKDVRCLTDFCGNEKCQRERSGPTTVSSSFALQFSESMIDPPPKATAQTSQSQLDIDLDDSNNESTLCKERQESQNYLGSIIASMQLITSSVMQMSLCKYLWTRFRRYKKQNSPHALNDGCIFLSKTSARNPRYMTAKDETQTQKVKHNPDNPIGFLHGEQAFNYYKFLTNTEAAMSIKQMNIHKDFLVKHYRLKKKMLVEFVELAKEFYKSPTEENRLRWKHLKKDIEETGRTFSDARKHFSKVRCRTPFFSLALMLSHTVALVVLCAKLGLERTGIQSYKTTQVNIPTFLGSETFTVVEEPNPWIGPPERSFWLATAAVTLCMGATSKSLDYFLNDGRNRVVSADKNLNITKLSPEMGCCEMGSHFNRAGTTTYVDCIKLTSGLGKWRSAVMCSERSVPNNHVAHVIKPCCQGPSGTCRMLSHEHCFLVKGIFHSALDHCGQTKCAELLCRLKRSKMLAVLPKDNKDLHLAWFDWFPWLAVEGADSSTSTQNATSSSQQAMHQWWRLITAIFLTFGVLHLLLVLVIEATIMLPVEIYAGWHRVLLIHACSALAGEMMACSVEPSRPHVGSTAGAAGFLAVAFLELHQAWGILSCPLAEVAGLFGVTLVFLALGTLHLVSIASVLAGLVVGFTLSLMILPYITLGQGQNSGRLRVVLVGFVLFMLVSTVILVCYVSTVSSELHEPSALLTKLLRYLQKWECIGYSEKVCLTYRNY